MRFLLFLPIATLAIAGEFTTSLGDTNPYQISAITTDAVGNTYVFGNRMLNSGGISIAVISGAVPPVVFTSPPTGGTDVFVSKLDPNGKLLFTDTFAGKGVDTGAAIALDPSGNIYIAGTTTSNDFPLSKPLQSQPNTTYGTGFIIKLTNDGKTILYSTYFGGTQGATSITSLATDSNGNLYLTGMTTAADFPHTPGMPFGPLQQGTTQTGPAAVQSVSGAIVTSISAAGDKILYSGAIVGTTVAIPNCPNPDRPDYVCFVNTAGVGIGVDAAGNAYIAGNTGTSNLPVTPGVFASTGAGAFVAKVNAAGISYLSYIGSGEIVSFEDEVFSAANTLTAIAVDAAGNAYLAGSSTNLATTPGSLQPILTGKSPFPNVTPIDGFLAKLNPTGSALTWATYLPNGFGAATQAIAADGNGNVWATGTVQAPFPNTNGWTSGPEFLIGVNSTGSKLTYSALFPTGTIAESVSVDPNGFVHVAGSNGFVSAISPTTAPTMKIFGFQNAAGGNLTARISPAELISIYGPGIGPSTATSAPLSGQPGSFFYPKTVSGVQVTINGMNMPLLYVSANQINAIVPMEITPGTAATIRVINGTTISPDYPVQIVASAPMAFPTVLNQDFSFNSSNNPAKAGSIVTFYATGWQSSFAPLVDGQVAAVAQDACLNQCQVISNNGAGATATVLYGGAAPDIVAGVTQFNVQIGALAMSNLAYQFNFSIIGPGSVAQTVWIAH